MASPDMNLAVTGTPLLGDQELLDKYSYLTGSTVYLKHPGENDADAMTRLLSTPADEVCSAMLLLPKAFHLPIHIGAFLLHAWESL